ncbi:MAG: KEOPS complex subunit Cgi121 [Methanobrevibacter sp.]|jgi:KEOPS complex subunit Cgi121|nr:KEOPS complex subunit Cgi121 [Candidatus Methanoflexus mossambicus]
MLTNVEIVGFKGEITDIKKTLKEIDKIQDSCCDGCIIQLMNAKAIAGKKHLEHGIIHAINAFKRNENLAKDLSIEILLRTSAQRQISKAFDILGLKTGKMEIATVLINCPEYYIDELEKIFKREDNVLNPDKNQLKEIYPISNESLNNYNIEDILIDKTSSLIVEL